MLISASSSNSSSWCDPFCSLKWLFKVCESISFLEMSSFLALFRFRLSVILYDICLPLSDLIHLLWSWRGPSLLLQMALFPRIWWLSNIPLLMCTTSTFPFHLTKNFLVASKVGFKIVPQCRLGSMCLLQSQIDLDVARVWDCWVTGYLHLQDFKEHPFCAPQWL